MKSQVTLILVFILIPTAILHAQTLNKPAEGYYIYRSSDGKGANGWQVYETVGLNSTTVSDSPNYAYGTHRCYNIKAYGTDWGSEMSPPVCVDVAPEKTVTLAWDPCCNDDSGLLPLPKPTNLKFNCSTSSSNVTMNWDAVPNATDYWTRAQSNGTVVDEAWKDGGNPGTSITFQITSGQSVDFWVHSYSANYPAADPSWPKGVGHYGLVNFICNWPTPLPPTNLRLRSVSK